MLEIVFKTYATPGWFRINNIYHLPKSVGRKKAKKYKYKCEHMTYILYS